MKREYRGFLSHTEPMERRTRLYVAIWEICRNDRKKEEGEHKLNINDQSLLQSTAQVFGGSNST